jgi:hydrogenase maturation protein HypF
VTALAVRVGARLAEERLPSALCVVLDGLAPGDDGTLWGGEFLLAGAGGLERLGTFKPVALPGGPAAAAREPWRSTYAHLMAEMGWPRFEMNYGGLELHRFLAQHRLDPDEIAASPRASSCRHLLDAAAAALGLCREAPDESAAARSLEAAVDRDALLGEDESLVYPFGIPRLRESGLPYVEPLGAWEALLGDLFEGTPAGVIAARFQRGLARAIARMADKLVASRAHSGDAPPAVVLFGCDESGALRDEVVRRLSGGLDVRVTRNAAQAAAPAWA